MEKDQATCDHNCGNCSVENCGSRGIEKLKPHELSKIKKTIAIISGKGGVGKSLVTTLVAVSLKNKGYKVGILDADVTGPSIPQAFGFKAYLCDGDENGIYPALTKNKMPIISSNLLLENPSAPLVWRGPMISNLVSQLYSQVIFGELDYLLIDMPPGTGDVPLTVFQQIPVDGCIVVSSPQDLVSLVVSKSVNMADEMHIPMLGLIENMAYTAPEDFGWDIIMGFRKMAEPAGARVEVVPLTVQTQKQIPYDQYMLSNGYAGAFFLGLTLNDPWMQDFRSSRTPAVLYDNHVRSNPYTAYLGIDNDEGMDLAVARLKALGHRKIGYLSGALGSYINQQRYSAFFQALRTYQMPDSPSLAGNSYYFSECLDVHLPRLLDLGVTAILCSSDLLAHTVLIRCHELGIDVPRQLSIVGFDDLPFCAHTAPPLTTIRQDRLQIGKSGYYALDSLLNGVPISSLLLHGQLILRGSTGPAPKPAHT